VAGSLSAVLQELARAPEADLGGAWDAWLRPGAVVGRFELLREIGRGGFGVVYEARDRELGRSVAFKAIRAGPRAALREERLLREAEAAARLSHPNVVTLFDVGRSEHGPYLVLELLHGQTLAKRLAQGPIHEREALRIGVEVAKGLAYAHSRGVAHRDLTPGNVFLCEDGQVKVLDFGLAHAFGQRRVDGGTPAYMAPEQWKGAPEDERTDVFALGVILYRMLAGSLPFPDDEPGKAVTGPRAAPALEVPDVPALGSLVARMLAKDPVARLRDGSEALAALATFQRELERTASGPLAPVRTRRRPRVRLAALLSIGAAAGAALALLVVLVRGRPPPAPAASADGRVIVAVADFANETPERELDSLSGLLITALEETQQLRVVTRSRMFDVLRQLGKEKVERIDEPLAREVGRMTGTRALLLATIRRLGDSYVVDMRALDPVRDEYLFTVRDRASGRDAVFDLIDRLGEASRRRLAGGGGSAAPVHRGVASVTTGNVKAWDHLFRARQAMDQGQFPEARRLLAAALQADPEFALAQYQLAVAASWYLTFREALEQADRPHIDAALRYLDRLPEKERLLLLALKAFQDGRFMESTRIHDRAAEAYPLDKEAVFYAGDSRFHSLEEADSIPYFKRALQLDPAYGLAMAHLVDALVQCGRADEHLAWLRGEALAARPELVLRAVARGLLATGREDDAIAAFRRATERGGNPWPPPALTFYQAFTGRAVEAESALRAALAGQPEAMSREHPEFAERWNLALALTLAAQGRFKDAEALYGAVELPAGLRALLRLLLWQATRSAAGARASAEDVERFGAFRDGGDLRNVSVGDVSSAATVLAHAGDVAAGARLAKMLRASRIWEELPSAVRRSADALAAWGGGSREAAEAGLLALADHSNLSMRYEGSLLLGDLAREREDCARTVTSLERARSLRWSSLQGLRIWTYPSLLQSLALCYERMGDLDKARERNDELLALWKRADPDLPLLAEAKALAKRLAASHAAAKQK